MDRKNKMLTSLEYSGLEALMQRIITAYEDYQNIPTEDQTPAGEIIKRSETGIVIHDGEYNLYLIEDLAIKSLFTYDSLCIMAGFKTEGKDLKDCSGNSIDTLIDVTEFLDEHYIDIDRLIEKIRAAR